MDNFVSGDDLEKPFNKDLITKFYSSSAWIDDRAERQLEQVAGWPGIKRIAAFPDLHLGKYGPVGCAILADRVYPELIGNDIGCGMSLFQLEISPRKFKLERALRRIRVIGEAAQQSYAHRFTSETFDATAFAGALGTIGGGNHFCEIQTLASTDKSLDFGAMNLHTDCLYLLVHSGSRSVGSYVFQTQRRGDGAKLSEQAWTKKYVALHDAAVRWASLNRCIIAERAAYALRAELRLLADVPHNVLSKTDEGWLHRKGAADASNGLIPLAGSRSTPSFLIRPSGLPSALQSTAHGAGRRYDRNAMHGRVRAGRSELEAMQRNNFGGRIICEDKDLMIEESAQAYKSSQQVVDDLALTGAATTVAEFHPLLTFKKIRKGGQQ